MKDSITSLPSTHETKPDLVRLIEYTKKGFVFHGSPNGWIRVLEPRLSSDAYKKSGFNVDSAIFAAHSPHISVLFACISNNSLPQCLHKKVWSIVPGEKGDVVARIPASWQPFIKHSIGYVYVLPGETFTEDSSVSWQVKSTVSVTPVDKIRVCFSDYKHLGGALIWEQETDFDNGSPHQNRLKKSSLFTHQFIGRTLTIAIDRPLGSNHPKHGFEYPVNYGFLPGVLGGDGEELDAYILGINEPLETFTGVCIAIIHRLDDDDDKLVIVPEGTLLSNEEIRSLTHFQEQWFTSEIWR